MTRLRSLYRACCVLTDMARYLLNAVLVLGLVAALAPMAIPQGFQAQPRLPEGVKALRDLAYVSNGHQRQKLDLYVPASRTKLPVVIHVHGGAWMAGEKGLSPSLASLLSKGFAVADINYRLAQDAIWPAQIEDCKAAVRWLRANSGKYNLDAKRFAAMGESAGGHLVAVLGTAGQTKRFDVGENLSQSSAVQAVVDHYGPTDLAQIISHRKKDSPFNDPINSPEAKLIGGPLDQKKEQAKSANPITYISKRTPPFFIAHGTNDNMVPCHQGQLLYDALKKAGIPVTFVKIEGADHGYMGASRDKLADLDSKVEAFLKSVLKVP